MTPGDRIEIQAPSGDVHEVEFMAVGRLSGKILVREHMTVFYASKWRAVGETEWRER